MKNIFLVIVLFFVLGLVGMFFFNGVSPSQPTTVTQSDHFGGEQGEKMQTEEIGRYVSFSSEIFANTNASRRVLFFYANWCPTCKPADESFTKNSAQLPDDVVLIRVNYNDSETNQSEKDLAKKYAVTYQHTFVQIDAGGNEITKWNGGQIGELLKNIR